MKLIQRSNRLFEIQVGYVKVYIIKGESESVLIDTAVAGKGEQILQTLDEGGIPREQIKHIILTQLHNDHTGSLLELKQATGARVYAHELEADAIEQGIDLRPCSPAPTLISHMVLPLLKKSVNKSTGPGCPVDQRLKDSQYLDLAGGFRIIHTPGHTQGHICLYLEDEKIMIMGDAASGGKKPQYPYLFEDREQGEQTLKKLGDMDFEQAYFGHGKEIVSDASRKIKERFSSPVR